MDAEADPDRFLDLDLDGAFHECLVSSSGNVLVAAVSDAGLTT